MNKNLKPQTAPTSAQISVCEIVEECTIRQNSRELNTESSKTRKSNQPSDKARFRKHLGAKI